MDTLRGQYGEWPEAEAYDPAEDDIGHEPPPQAIGQDERRMQVRAYNLWAGLLGDRAFPLVADLEPGTMPDFDRWSVLLEFTNGPENPAVRYIGKSLVDESGLDTTTIRTLADVPGRSLLSRITDHYMQILANQAPIGFEAEFVNERGRTILYRGILLPFSNSLGSTSIDCIYGVINWKEMADQQTTDALMQEIDEALQPRKPALAAPEPLPLTAWANGPMDLSADVFDLSLLGGGEESFDWGHDLSLADRLASARELAEAAQGADDRSRQALYAAVARAHDCALAAEVDPETFRELVADAGIAMQERAPLIPLVKLVFGTQYDKTRLTEYATVIGHARRIDLGAGMLAEFLATAPGGLKGVVQLERRLRREEAGAARAPSAGTRREAMLNRLRALPARPIAALAADDREFTLLVARRNAVGEIEIIGATADDETLLDRAARNLVG